MKTQGKTQWVCDLMTDPYFVAIIVPIILLVSGTIVRKIVRGPGWQRNDCYLGIEFTLAALASTLFYLFDLIKLLSSAIQPYPPEIIEKFQITALFIVVTFGLLMSIMALHQDWERRTNKLLTQFFYLGILGNTLGSGLLFSFVTIVKGVR